MKETLQEIFVAQTKLLSDIQIYGNTSYELNNYTLPKYVYNANKMKWLLICGFIYSNNVKSKQSNHFLYHQYFLACSEMETI